MIPRDLFQQSVVPDLELGVEEVEIVIVKIIVVVVVRGHFPTVAHVTYYDT